MGRRVLPVVLVLLAVAADSRGLHAVGTYLLVVTVPAAAAAVLTRFGELVQLPGKTRGVAALRAEVVLGVVALVTVVVAAAARGGAVEGGGIPPVAVSALVACLAALALQAFVALLAPPVRPDARPRVRPNEPSEEPAQAA
jgi:hypothetical protein